MSTEWILAADAALARILVRPEPGSDLQEVEQITDPAAHDRGTDRRRDAYGRRGGDDLRMGGNATTSASDEGEHLDSVDFARRVAARLDEALREGSFDSLRIVAEPRFLGHLRRELAPPVAAVVKEEIDKDVIHEDLRTLTRRLYPG